MIQFVVFGRPAQRGSKTPFVARHRNGEIIKRANGSPVVAMKDSNNDKSKDWMAQVRQVASEHFSGDLLRGAVRISIVFYFARPKGHFGKGRNANLLKPKAPRFHTQMPDCDKLTRCLCDALTSVVFADDAQICALTVAKDWTTQQARAEVVIEEVIDPNQGLPTLRSLRGLLKDS